LFDNDLLSKERETNSQRSRPATQEVPYGDDFSHEDEPGLKCEARETFKILIKGNADQCDGSEKNTDSDGDTSVRPEDTSESWKDRHNLSYPYLSLRQGVQYHLQTLDIDIILQIIAATETVCSGCNCNQSETSEIFVARRNNIHVLFPNRTSGTGMCY
jgi:hypothetical protein